MIAIISDEKQENIGQLLFHVLQKESEKMGEVKFIPISDKKVQPCVCCGGCESKSYGKCVVRDDMDQILPIVVKENYLIITTQVVWGGPSFSVKKVLDKTALLGNRFYKVRNGELVKGTGYPLKKLIFFGVTEDKNRKSSKDFLFFVNEMGTILDVKRQAFLVSPKISEEELREIGKELFI